SNMREKRVKKLGTVGNIFAQIIEKKPESTLDHVLHTLIDFFSITRNYKNKIERKFSELNAIDQSITKLQKRIDEDSRFLFETKKELESLKNKQKEIENTITRLEKLEGMLNEEKFYEVVSSDLMFHMEMENVPNLPLLPLLVIA